MMRRLILLAVLGLACASTSNAVLTGPAITDNDFLLDLSVGPVTGSNRMIALGGAYVGIAKSLAGIGANPAGVVHFSGDEYPRWKWGFSLGFSKALGKDFDNNGSVSTAYDNHQLYSAGIQLQHRKWGFGILFSAQRFDVPAGNQLLEYSFILPTASLGRSFFGRQLNLAIAGKPSILEVIDSASRAKVFELKSENTEFGLLWNPNRGPLRVGFTYRSREKEQQLLDTAAGPVTVGGLFVPTEVELPARSSLGVSYVWPSVLGGRELLFTGQVTVVGKSRGAFGIESFLEQKEQAKGTKTTVSEHFGVQLELVPKRLRGRLGTYFEPTRFADSKGRVHATGGFEIVVVREWLVPDSSFTLQYAFDISRDYSKHSVSLGVWEF